MTSSVTNLQAFGNSAPSVLKEGPTIRAIAVAGVGSSALGTAALARNFADALNTDVAGIVTGYGLSDVMTEAFGGWFAFGAADRIRYTMERILRAHALNHVGGCRVGRERRVGDALRDPARRPAQARLPRRP